MGKKLWHKHYAEGVASSVSFKNETLHRPLERNARNIPNKDALIFLDFFNECQAEF